VVVEEGRERGVEGMNRVDGYKEMGR